VVPLVGVALGFLLYGVNTLAQLIFPASVSAALTVFAWIIFTRAFSSRWLHGYLRRTLRRLHSRTKIGIMKDSRMGAFGTIGGALVLLTEYTALHSSVNLLSALLLATTLGRWASPLVIYFFPYAREEGLGIEMKRNVRLQEVLVATLIAGVTSWFAAGGWLGLVLMLGAAIIAFIVAWYAMRLLHGLTGDIYGTVTTTVEMFILLIFTIS
jgi:adenosylcobinamide-GDP ribazoletransferase